MRPASERKEAKDAIKKKVMLATQAFHGLYRAYTMQEAADLRAKSIAEPGVVFGIDDNGEIYLKRSNIERAIEHIIEDFTFLSMFFITHRSFTTPKILLQLLMKRFEASTGQTAQQNRIRICIVLKHWISNHWEDFDDVLLETTREFLRGSVMTAIASSANILLQLIEKKKSGAEALHHTDKPLSATLTQELWNPRAITSVSPIEVARQLTMIEQDLFLAMRCHEFLGQGWLKPEKDVLAPNIVVAVKWFNRLSYWWGTEILLQPGNQQRVAYCEWLIKLAQELFTLQNYSSVLQILSALQSTPIRRLTDIWEAMASKSKKAFDQIAASLAPTQNWQQQRELLANKSPPSIPYIGMYLTDLTFLDESAPTSEKDLINFEKLRKVAGVIQEIQLYQQARHSFETLDFVRQYLFSVEPLDEAARYERSYALLPRGARNTVTSPDTARLLVASTSFGSSDLDALKTALLDSITSTDVCSRVHDVYIAFQKSTSQILRSKGSTIATFTDQSKSVYDTVSRVTMEVLEFGSSTYVILCRLVVYRSTLAHAKKLASFYGVQTGHSAIRPLVLYAVLETDDLADHAREQDVILMQVAPRLNASSKSSPSPSAPESLSPRARGPSAPAMPLNASSPAMLSSKGSAPVSAPVPIPASATHPNLSPSMSVSPPPAIASPPLSAASLSPPSSLSLSSSSNSRHAVSPPPTAPLAAIPPTSLTQLQKGMMPDPVVFTSVPKNWLEFFKMGGFSKETSESYSALFQEHAVEMEQMSDITAQVLRDMGLRVGPIMRVQRAIAAYLDFTKAKLAK